MAKKIKVLLVDDDKDDLEMLEEALKIISTGHSIVEASNGQEALEKTTTETVDLMAIDLNMPGMDGYEAARRIRALEAQTSRPRTPIVAVTAHALTGDREECLKAGMDDYLSKPVSERRMADVLTRWLSADDPSFRITTVPARLEPERALN